MSRGASTDWNETSAVLISCGGGIRLWVTVVAWDAVLVALPPIESVPG